MFGYRPCIGAEGDRNWHAGRVRRIQVELVDADAPFVQQLQPRRGADHLGVHRIAGQDEISIGDQRQVLAPVGCLGETDREAGRQFGADLIPHPGVHGVEECHAVGHSTLQHQFVIPAKAGTQAGSPLSRG
jgi:hypothetical protein